MMTFANIDDRLASWSKRHGLFVFTMCRDDEVRSIDVVDDAGTKYQIWIERLADQYRVCAWDYASRHHAAETSDAGFANALEDVYGVAAGWIAQAGRTRTVAGLGA